MNKSLVTTALNYALETSFTRILRWPSSIQVAAQLITDGQSLEITLAIRINSAHVLQPDAGDQSGSLARTVNTTGYEPDVNLTQINRNCLCNGRQDQVTDGKYSTRTGAILSSARRFWFSRGSRRLGSISTTKGCRSFSTTERFSLRSSNLVHRVSDGLKDTVLCITSRNNSRMLLKNVDGQLLNNSKLQVLMQRTVQKRK